MLQNPESEKLQSVGAQGIHVAFDEFLDVREVVVPYSGRFSKKKFSLIFSLKGNSALKMNRVQLG